MSDLTFSRLVLHDFKSFLSKHIIELNRPAGLYYIQGKNKRRRRLGSNAVGKTSIWDGISWVLWGTTGRDRRPASAVVPWSKPDAHTWGKLIFTRGSKTIKLVRRRNPNKLTANGRVIEQNEVPNLLGMSEEMFRRSVVLSQFEELFLDLLPEKQSRLFNEALDLEVWLKASKAADTKRRATLEECFRLRDEMSKLLGRRKEIKEQLREAKKNKRNYEANLNRDIDKLSKQATNAGKNSLRLLKEYGFKKLGDLKESINNRTSELSELDRRLRAAAKSPKSKTCPTCGQTIYSKKVVVPKQSSFYVEENDLIRLKEIYDEASEYAADYDEAKEEMKRLQSSDNPYHSTFLDLTERLAVVRKSLDEKEQDYADLEKEVEVYSYWQDAFKEIRISLIDQVLEELEMAVTNNAEALGLEGYRIEFQTQRESKSGNVTVVFNVLLHTPEYDKPVKWESYSGGESQRLQLAMAFGLSEVILSRVGINPNIEVLDEPTHHTSTEGVDDLIERLKDRATELNKAIYFCDHHSYDRGDFDGTLLVTKDKRGSNLTEVS